MASNEGFRKVGGTMKPFRALMATLWVYSSLVWLYCIVRIFTGDFPFSDEFIAGIPITFLQLSIGAFLISMITFNVYLCLEDT